MNIMPIESNKSEGLTEIMPVNCHYFALSGDMTINSAAQDHQDFLAAVSESDAVAIDLSQLEEIDTSGMQQLLAIKRWFEKQSKPCHMHSSSDEVTSLLQLFNLENRLEQA